MKFILAASTNIYNNNPFGGFISRVLSRCKMENIASSACCDMHRYIGVMERLNAASLAGLYVMRSLFGFVVRQTNL